jgi:RecJ-like exonuclease
MPPLKCYWCKGHGYVLVAGSKETCPECGGCGLDGDVIRERAEEDRKSADDRAWVARRIERSGAYSEWVDARRQGNVA